MSIGSHVLVVVVLSMGVAFGSTAQGGTVCIQGRTLFADGTVPTLAHVSVGGSSGSRMVETDTGGNYTITDLPPGTYNLTAFGVRDGKAGMFVQQGIQINPDTPLPMVINITLSSPTPGQ